MRRRRWLYGLIWVVATLGLSAAGSFWVLRLREHDHDAAGRDAEEVFHEWMHTQLELTAEQRAILEPHERAFDEERRRLQGRIKAAGQTLASRVQASASMTEATRAALGELSGAQGELQRVTLEHFYQMKAHLNAAQQERLLKWTHDSLVPDHDD